MGNENKTQDSSQQGGHPAYKEILDVLPESLHAVVMPTLKKWDEGVNNKLQSVRDEYKAYEDFKPLVENNVNTEAITQALYVVDMMREKPEDVLQELIKNFDLPYVPKSELEALQTSNSGTDDPDVDFGDMNIEDHPMFKQLKDTVETLTKSHEETQAERKQREAAEAAEAYMGNLKEKHGEFDRDYVGALISIGMDGDQAVKKYFDTINQAAQKLAGTSEQDNQNQSTNGTSDEEPPVVLGGTTNGGSGLPNDEVDVGALSEQQVKEYVAQLAANAANSND